MPRIILPYENKTELKLPTSQYIPEIQHVATIEVVDTDIEFATLIGKARQVAKAYHPYGRLQQYRIGYPETEKEADITGALGEILVQKYLSYRKGFDPGTLVSIQPWKGADFKLDGRQFDVKGFSWKSKQFKVNEKSHKKHTREDTCDFYVGVRISYCKHQADMFQVSRAAVDYWQVAHGYSDYHFKALPIDILPKGECLVCKALEINQPTAYNTPTPQTE